MKPPIPVDPPVRYFALAVLAATFAVGLSGCSSDNPAGPPPHFSRDSAVQFAVRSGTTMDPTGLPGVFDNGRDESFVEFPIDFAPSMPVVVSFRVTDLVSNPNDWPFEFRVSTYRGNGQSDLSDYGSGTFAETFTIDGVRTSHTIDITGQVAWLQQQGATHVGLRFHDSTYDQLAVNIGTLEAGP